MIIKPSSSGKNSATITDARPDNKKETVSESRNKPNTAQGKMTYSLNEQATNKRSLTETNSSPSVPLNKDAKKFEAFFAQPTLLISLNELIKTNYPDTSFFKKVSTSSHLFIDNSISANKIQPGKRQFKISWTYTPFVSYEWAQYRIDSDLPAVNSIKQGNEHEPSFSAGLLLTGQFADKWMFQSGIIYSNTTIDIAPQKIYAIQSPNGDYAYKYITSAGYGYIRPGFGTSPSLGDSLSTAEAEHTLRHVTIPLLVKYNAGRGKFSILPGAGIAVNFLTGTKVETEVKNAIDKETVTITKLTGVRKLNWSLAAEAEVQYKLNNKTSLSLRPTFRYAISSITRNDDFQTFPYAFGIGLGMTVKF